MDPITRALVAGELAEQGAAIDKLFGKDEKDDEPKKCPECGSDKVKKEGDGMTCEKCGHEWGGEGDDKD